MTAPLSAALFSAATSMGLGLLGVLGIFSASGLVPADRGLGAAGLALALGTIVLGLVAGLRCSDRPEADWPLHARWQDSWAARAGIFASAATAAGVMFTLGWVVLGDRGGVWRWFGLFGTSFSAIAVYCIAMIYATQHPVPQWSNRWVAPNFFAQALLVGALWLNALTVAFGGPSPDIAMLVTVGLFFAFYVKRRYWRLVDMIAHAMGRDARPPDDVRKDRRTAFLMLFAVPLLLTMHGIGKAPEVAIPLLTLAAISGSGGLLVERRLFLHEAAPTDPPSDSD